MELRGTMSAMFLVFMLCPMNWRVRYLNHSDDLIRVLVYGMMKLRRYWEGNCESEW